MKRSELTLLATGAIFAAAVMGSVVSERFAPSPEDSSFTDEAPTKEGSALRGFRKIAFEGRWQVSLRRGGDWRVEISYPEGKEVGLRKYVIGDRLHLNQVPPVWWEEPDFTATADIVMPMLEELKLKGYSRLDMRGFRGSRLEIDIAGVANIRGLESRYRDLDLKVAGVGVIDLRGVTVMDADIDIAGPLHVTLTMDGGSLSGSIQGTGILAYSGPVSESSIDLAGDSHVESLR